MPTKLYDDEDMSTRSGLSPDGSHDDLGVGEDERQKEIDELERLYRGEDSPKKKDLDADGISSAEDEEVGDEQDASEGTERSSLARQTATGNSGDKNFFVPDAKNSGGGLLKNAAKKRAAIIASSGVIGLLLSLGGFMGFLSTFRLKHLMENINFQAFSRYNAAVDRRSDKWVRTYFKIRMMEWDGQANPDGDGNIYFRANKVDTNNPVRDWYRTMRTSKFEADLLQTHGIQFTSVIGPDGKVRAGKIDISGRTVDIIPDGIDGDFVVVDDLLSDSSKFNALASRIDGGTLEIFENDKAARRTIKDAVDKNTRKWQVIKRRHLRKSIANMTGVRDWRFFDKTRTKIEDKRAEFKRKMIKKVFPENDSRAGNFLMCILGIGSCTATTDPSNPDNQKGVGSTSPNGNPDSDEQALDPDGKPAFDENGKPVYKPVDPEDLGNIDKLAKEGLEELVDDLPTESAFNKELIQKMQKYFTKQAGNSGPLLVKKLLDWALLFETNLRKNPSTGRSKIGDAIYTARLTGSLMLVYSTISTIADQMQSGEVDPDQVNTAMEYFDGASNSEGFNMVFYGKDFGNNVLQTRADGTKVNKCASGEPFDKDDLVPFCESFKPNGGSSVSGIEDGWNKYISNSPLGEILRGYRKLKNTFLGGIFDKITDFIGEAASAVITPIMDSLGLSDVLADVAGWLSDRLLTWVGVKPCITGSEDTGGMAVNCLVGGAAGSAETAARSAGGILVKVGDAAYNYSENLAVEYMNETYDSMSTYDRYFAVNNHLSLASSLLFGFSLHSNPRPVFGNLISLKGNFSKAFDSLGSVFSGKAKAQSMEYKNLARFSGVDSYAIPKECVELDPMDSEYINKATNNPAIARDPTILGNSVSFSEELYEKNGDSLDAGDIDTIYNTYNCMALDNVVRGGLGGVYGYTEDDGYSSSGTEANSGGASQIAGLTAGVPLEGQDTTNIPCHESPTSRFQQVENEAYISGTRYSINLCNVHGVQINSIVSKNYDDMFNAMATEGYTIRGSGGFRTMAEQTAGYNKGLGANTYAKPGYSNHQYGAAVDITCQNTDGSNQYQQGLGRRRDQFLANVGKYPCLNWIHKNSIKYGLLLQCDGLSSEGGEIRNSSGGCEWWHISPTGG